MTENLIRIALPPSLGVKRAGELGGLLEVMLERELSPAYSVRVAVALSYESLGEQVLAGDVDAAWAPPLVCARVEANGGRALVRARRGDASTFRSALVCRRDKPLDVASLAGVRAAWVDRASTAGYLLPISWLRERGVDLKAAIAEEVFAGSHKNALQSLVSGKADLAATYAAAASATRQYTGLDHLLAGAGESCRVIAFTHEAPNDAIVVGPGMAELTAGVLAETLLATNRSTVNRAVIREVFNADELEPAPKKGYRSLYNLVGVP